jgi:hypothetical protein
MLMPKLGFAYVTVGDELCFEDPNALLIAVPMLERIEPIFMRGSS